MNRTLTIAGCVMVAACLLCGPAMAQDKADANWPQWRGPNLDGQSKDVPQAWAKPKELWQKPMVGAAYGSPAVGGGIVVITDHKEGKEDYYRAYDAATGAEKWTYPVANAAEVDYGASPRGTPLILGDKVFVVGATGDMHALDIKTGKPVWKKHFDKDFGAGETPTWGFCTSLIAAGGNVIAMPGGNKGGLVALNPATGEVVWNGKAGGSNYSNLAIGKFGGVEQIVGYDGGALIGWNLKTGAKMWSLDVDMSKGYIVPAPVVVGDKLLLASEGDNTRLHSFGEDGKIKKEADATNVDLAPEMSTPAVMGKLVLGLHEGLVVLDAAKLTTVVKDEKERAFSGALGFIIASKDRALVIGDSGVLALVSVDGDKVKVLGSEKVCKGTQCHPALAGNKFYVRDAKALYCFEIGAAK